jgi:hypothetical protein
MPPATDSTAFSYWPLDPKDSTKGILQEETLSGTTDGPFTQSETHWEDSVEAPFKLSILARAWRNDRDELDSYVGVEAISIATRKPLGRESLPGPIAYAQRFAQLPPDYAEELHTDEAVETLMDKIYAKKGAIQKEITEDLKREQRESRGVEGDKVAGAMAGRADKKE